MVRTGTRSSGGITSRTLSLAGQRHRRGAVGRQAEIDGAGGDLLAGCLRAFAGHLNHRIAGHQRVLKHQAIRRVSQIDIPAGQAPEARRPHPWFR